MSWWMPEWPEWPDADFAPDADLAYGDFFVGWTAPPHPIDYIPSVEPHDSHQQQARAVLYDFHHDDDLKNWFDQSSVQHTFGVSSASALDPVRIIQAYENKNDPVWHWHEHVNPHDAFAVSAAQKRAQIQWSDLDKLVNGAIQKRLKLGPLPASTYDTDPVVIYYYDNDRMKKIVWPRQQIPSALDPANKMFWKRGGTDNMSDVFTYETQDPAKIDKERKSPGSAASCSGRDGCRGAGGWDDEGFDWNKDAVGDIEKITSAIMEVVGAVVQIIPGVGTAVGTALMIGGAAVAAIAGAIDDAFQGNDNAMALAGIAKALFAAASAGLKAEAHVDIPPQAMKALSGTVDQVAKAVSSGQKKNLSYSEIWNDVAKKAQSYGKLGDKEAHAIAAVLGPKGAGNLFIQGYVIGKLAEMHQIEAIAKIVQSYATFAKDPKALNIFLLGAGIGHLTAHQQDQKPSILPAYKKFGTASHAEKTLGRVQAPPAKAGAHKTAGDMTGPILTGFQDEAKEELAAFVAWRARPRYGLRHVAAGPSVEDFYVGQETTPTPHPDYSPLSRGCPQGYWWDPLSGVCREATPLPVLPTLPPPHPSQIPPPPHQTSGAFHGHGHGHAPPLPHGATHMAYDAHHGWLAFDPSHGWFDPQYDFRAMPWMFDGSELPGQIPGHGLLEDPEWTAYLRGAGVNALGDDGSAYEDFIMFPEGLG